MSKNPQEMSEKELLIRIDERFSNHLRRYERDQKASDKRMTGIEEEAKTKVSRSSVLFVITVVGGIMGIISLSIGIASKYVEANPTIPLP